MTPNKHPEKLNNFVLFKTADCKVNIDVYFHDDTLWLTQKIISELYQKDRSVITSHLEKIFEEGESDERVVSAKLAQTTQHGAIQGKATAEIVYTEEVKIKAEIVYNRLRVTQDKWYISDFSEEIKKLIDINRGNKFEVRVET